MSNISLFEGKVPAYLAKLAAANVSDLTANVGTGGFPVMSIKGKTWALVKSGERETLMNPNDADEPATSINVVIVKANAGLSKVWYAKAFVEGTDAKPDCFSHNGVAPDPTVEKPQASKCAICAKNQWGSKISEDGKKFKACADSRRVAIARPDALDEPIMLRVPAGSLKNLADFGADLAKRGIPYSAVVTKLGFDRDAASPKLTFKAVAALDEDEFNQVQATVAGETVQSILGTNGADAVIVGESLDQEAPVAETPKPAAKAKPAPVADDEDEAPAKVTKSAAKAKPAPVADDEDEAPAKPAAKAAKPAAKPVKVVEASDSIEDELDNLLGELE